jgi:hypothetical protein
MLCVYAPTPKINFYVPEIIFMKHGMYIKEPEPISAAYFINLSHQSVCLYVYPPLLDRQLLSNYVTAAMNTHETIEELLDASFSMWSVSYQRKVGDWLFTELLVFFLIF